MEQQFRQKILELLLSEGQITEITVTLMGKRGHLAIKGIFENSGVFD